LAATSRAFPGDVSIRMNAFTDMFVSSRRASELSAARVQRGGGINVPFSS
jgi:hypothetical protein